MVLRILFLGLLLSAVAACVTAPPATSPVSLSSPEPTGETGAEMGNHPPCVLPPLMMPATPETLPGYTDLDSSTGLHVTGTMQVIDQTRYRLEVTGKVNRQLSLSYDELRCMPRAEARLTLICPGFFEDVATWSGTPLKYILELAQVQPDATGFNLISADQYSAPISLKSDSLAGSFLAYEWEGKALPRLHGFPLRAIFPGSEGVQWVKWLVRIEVY
jgi:DMSO/TMAO reductase YedYZ molybdopterin-dependent catalytic subunit